MPGSQSFTDKQVDKAIDYAVANGAEDRGQTISYSRIFGAAGLPAPQMLHMGGESHLVTAFMERFHYRCTARNLPPLDSLVVHVAGERENFPGSGYFRVNGYDDPLDTRTKPEQQDRATKFWESQKEECREWGVRSRRGRS